MISGPTHEGGHTLDLVLSLEQVVKDLKVGDTYLFLLTLIFLSHLSVDRVVTPKTKQLTKKGNTTSQQIGDPHIG